MKRKVLISVLTVALVLTLCIGLFAACDKTPAEPSQYKVTYDLGEYTGTEAAPAPATVDAGGKLTLPAVGVTWADHTFLGWQLEGSDETLDAGTEVTVNSNLNYIAKWQDDSEALPKVTIYYTLGTELKSVVKDVMTTEEAGKYQLNAPSDYLPDEEWSDFMAQLGKAEKYSYYYYDADATDHKGAAFAYKEFEADADFAIIIIKESIGTLATSIDESWYGVYAGQSMMGQPFRLTISDADGGTIKLDDSMQGALGQIPAENIYNTADGKLVLVKQDEWDGSYLYYYFTKNADGSITMESDDGTVQLAKAQEINVKVYYPIDAQGTLHTIDVKAYKIGETCSLDDTPEDSIDADWGAFEAQGGYDKEMHYYFYNNQQKGDEFDWREFEADGDISIIIEFAKFADKLSSIDSKYNGTFRGTSEYWEDTFVLTVSSADGTASLQYANEENSVFNFEASIDDGSILTKDGKLVLAKGNKLYPTYFYLSEKDGAYTFDSNEEKDVALQKDASYADIIGGYKATGGGIIYTSDVLSDDTYLGSLLYDGELIPILSFTAAADGSYTLFGVRSDESELTATYKAADKSITIGTDAYTLDEEAPKASITDFVGYWERSDTKQYWDIQRFNQYYGKEEPKKADFEPIGDYIYLFYEQANNTYYYLLQVHTEGDVKTLVGTYVAPGAAPKQVTFNATEKYEAPVELTEYATEKPITITSNDKAKTLTVSKIEIGTFDVAAKTMANNLKIYVNIDSKEEVWEFTEIGLGSGKMFSYSSFEKDGILLAWTATYDKDGSTFKFVFGIKEEKAETIYLYDYNSEAELGGLTLDGKGVEPSGSEGPGTEEPDLPEIPEGAVTYVGEAVTESGYTITKVIIDPSQKVTSAIVIYTKDGKEETKEFTIAPPTYVYENYWNGNYAGHDIKFYYAYTASDPNFNIVIYDDGTCMIGDGDDGYLATFKDENAGKATYTGEAKIGDYTITKVVIDTTQQVTSAIVTYTKDGNEETKEFTIAPPTYVYENYWNGNYAGHDIKFYYAYTASDPNFNIVIYDDDTCMIGDSDDGYIATFQREGGEQEEPTMLNGDYVMQGGTNKLSFKEDGTFTFYYNGMSHGATGTYSSTGANTYYGETNEDDTFKITLNPDGTLTVDGNLPGYDGTYALEEAEPEYVTYTGEIKLTNIYGEWTLVEIKFDKADIQNTLTFKVKDNDTEFTATWKDPSEYGYADSLAYFRVNDGTQHSEMNYVAINIKYGADENSLLVLNSNYDQTLGTLTKQGSAIEPAKTVQITVEGGEHGTGSYVFELPLDGEEHTYQEIYNAIKDGEAVKGENKFWYLSNQFKVDGATKRLYDAIEFSEAKTIQAVFADDWTIISGSEYPYIDDVNLGSSEGSGTLYRTYSLYNDITYKYDLEAGTIDITVNGTTFHGTIGDTNANHELTINITLTVGEKDYTFGTGSPTTGGGTKVKITLKAGDHGKGQDVTLEVNSGEEIMIYNSDEEGQPYFTADSNVWFFENWIVNDDPEDTWDKYDKKRAFTEDTTLTAGWSDLWSVYDEQDNELDFYLSHESYTGKLISGLDEVEFQYVLNSEDNTIQITLSGQTYNGTYSFALNTDEPDYEYYELIVNITLEYKSTEYVFGTGSPNEEKPPVELPSGEVTFECDINVETGFGTIHLTKIVIRIDGVATSCTVTVDDKESTISDDLDFYQEEDIEYVGYMGDGEVKYAYNVTIDSQNYTSVYIIVLTDGTIDVCTALGVPINESPLTYTKA